MIYTKIYSQCYQNWVLKSIINQTNTFSLTSLPFRFILEKLVNYDKVYFFNRLNIPKKVRDLGLGKELLQEVINYCNEKEIFLVNTASSSGDMRQKKLIDFYISSGMKLIHNEGLLVYYSGITPNIKKKIKL